MKNARTANNTIVEIMPDGDLSQMYHPDILATVQDVPDEAEVGMVWDGAVWVHPYTGPTAESVRAERDRLLAESDWTQLADAPLTDEEKTAWAAKRQALRDVPQQAGFPWAVVWPG